MQALIVLKKRVGIKSGRTRGMNLEFVGPKGALFSSGLFLNGPTDAHILTEFRSAE